MSAASVRDSWRLAVGTLTAIRVRPPSTVGPAVAGTAMLLAPLAVLPLGLAMFCIAAAGDRLNFAPQVSAVLAVGAVAMGNRAMHWDGLSDTIDGLAASYDAQRSLAAMKSGTSGPAGVVGVVVVLLAQVAGFSAVIGSYRGAALAGVAIVVSRSALALCSVRGIPAARREGLGATFAGTVPRTAAGLVLLASAVIVAFAGHEAGLPWWRGIVAVAAATLVVAELVRRSWARVGGVTGDLYGAAIELAVAAIAVALS